LPIALALLSTAVSSFPLTLQTAVLKFFKELKRYAYHLSHAIIWIMATPIRPVNLTAEDVVKGHNVQDLSYTKKELEKFGLSPNQAQIYLLLVQYKELRIQEIVKLSQIPRSSVYECLKGLFELGIAEEVIRDTYKTIRPYSVGVMRHGLDEQMLQLKRLTSDLENLEKTLALSELSNSSHQTSVRYYKGRSGARQLYWNTLKAQSTVYVYSDWGRGRYVGMRFYENFVAESRNRNIKEKVLINLKQSTLESIKKLTYPGSSISRTRLEDIRVINKEDILIQGDTLIYDDVYSQVYLKNVEINGFEIQSKLFTDTQRSIFETLWKMGKPIEIENKPHKAN
jgi:sugar-specific transcriptional regulator TrmB